jgi:hypothetical protein
MTRQQQNDLILQKLADKLVDEPNVQKRIETSFKNWFAQFNQPPAPPAAEGEAPPEEVAPPAS